MFDSLRTIALAVVLFPFCYGIAVLLEQYEATE